MAFCDICGFVRRPLPNIGTSDSSKTDPFKFDVPSPDDVIFTGIHSSKVGLKDNATIRKSLKLSSSIREINELSVRGSDFL